MQATHIGRRNVVRRSHLLAFAAAACLSACSTVHVDSEFDKDSDFARFKTFRWVEAPPVGVGDPRVDGLGRIAIGSERGRHPLTDPAVSPPTSWRSATR